MQTFDFDRLIERRATNSYKWDQSETLFGDKDILPLWVADMDFQSPPAVVAALTDRAAHGVYGYTIRPQSYFQAIVDWLKTRHQWDVPQAWLATCPGVVTALSMLIQQFTAADDAIVVQTPVYYPFFDVVRMNGRTLIENPLLIEDGIYKIDFHLLEQQFASGVKMMLLCSPHNPGGRVWSVDELHELGRLCLKYGVLVVSDEIHCDLVMPGHRHVPLASLSPELAQCTITCIAPSKTFNMPGISTSTVIIPNEQLRRRYTFALKTLSLHLESYFAVTALEKAYTEGAPWLDAMLAYVADNLTYLEHFFVEHLPQLKVMRPQATYLVWIDYRALGLTTAEMKELMFKQAKVAFSDGTAFGGEGYIRINIACPRAILQEGLARFQRALAPVMASLPRTT
jgi:cystathionine beta-lyase